MADITILDLLNRLKAKKIETAGYDYNSLIQISRKSSKKRPAYVKIAISDDDAANLMKGIGGNPDSKEGVTTFYLVVLPWDKVREVFAEEREQEKVAP